MLLLNSFSLNMLASLPSNLKVEEVPVGEASFWALHGFTSFVGHQDVANLMGAELGVDVPMNRASATLSPEGETMALVGQYSGPRLPEGCTTLPEGATLRWLMVMLM